MRSCKSGLTYKKLKYYRNKYYLDRGCDGCIWKYQEYTRVTFLFKKVRQCKATECCADTITDLNEIGKFMYGPGSIHWILYNEEL